MLWEAFPNEETLIPAGLWQSGDPHPDWLLLGDLLEPLQVPTLNSSSTQPLSRSDLVGSGAPLFHKFVSQLCHGALREPNGTAGVRAGLLVLPAC